MTFILSIDKWAPFDTTHQKNAPKKKSQSVMKNKIYDM